MATKTVSLHEDRFFGTSPYTVEKEQAVIRGVKILGEQSQNGRRYSRKALESAAVMYEGIKVNLDHPPSEHPSKPRRISDRFGKLQNIKVTAEGVYGDLHYLPSHSMAAFICEASEKMPDAIGLSHNADGVVTSRNGENVVEEIKKVRSVDLVADPASTKSLFEECQMQTKPIKEFAKSMKAGNERKLIEALLEQDMIPAEAEVPATANPDEALKNGFKAAIHAIVDDDSLDVTTKSTKIKDLLKTMEKTLGGGSAAEAPAEEPAAEGKVEKPQTDPAVKQLQEQLAAMQRRDKMRELCDTANVKPSAAFLESLVAVSDASAKALIEERKAVSTQTGRPRSASLTEGLNGNHLPKDDAEWLATIKG